jgi:tryptophan 2,3-dioxygenase
MPCRTASPSTSRGRPEVDKALTYADYLRIDDLLALQVPRSDGPEHDEHLFIVVHQVYELWFKQLLHEAAHLQQRLDAGDAPAALHALRRILTILKTIVAQIDILETMTPLSFAGFRSRLESASGFQSAQFREWEAVLGRRDPAVLDHHPEGAARERIATAMARPGLWESFLRLLGTDEEGAREAILAAYRGDPLVAMVCERLVDLDEGVQEWRYRHLKMVERTIGSKAGTGGSSGASYLRSTISRPAFPLLWEIRSAW